MPGVDALAEIHGVANGSGEEDVGACHGEGAWSLYDAEGVFGGAEAVDAAPDVAQGGIDVVGGCGGRAGNEAFFLDINEPSWSFAQLLPLGPVLCTYVWGLRRIDRKSVV